ncbi:MAG: aspartate-semialdehyde dehydrogenase [Thermoplasmatota archaeon]
MIPVAVAGATGAVGQRFLQLLHEHPVFRVVAVAASPSRAGKRLGDATWVLDGDWPSQVADLQLLNLEDVATSGCRVVFSALPSEQAGPMETSWADAGLAVFTNASSHRMDPDVPLLIPEVNPDHLEQVRGRRGFIVANGNCSGIIVTLPLAALHREFGLEEADIMTQQAVSGAGIGGVDPASIHDNVLPFICSEEDKLEEEPAKTLGSDFPIRATCTRVDVSDGHLAALHVRLGRKATWDEVERCLAAFRGPDAMRRLHSAPERPIHVRAEADRPQPRLDRDCEGGMAVTVGRIRVDDDRVRLLVLGHNTVRGAAGQSVLNAEFAAANGLLD